MQDLIVGAVMGAFAFVSMVGGIFGMNMKNGWEESRVRQLPCKPVIWHDWDGASSTCTCKL